MAGRSGKLNDKGKATTVGHRTHKEGGIMRDDRGQTQPETEDDAQRTSGDVRPAKGDDN